MKFEIGDIVQIIPEGFAFNILFDDCSSLNKGKIIDIILHKYSKKIVWYRVQCSCGKSHKIVFKPSEIRWNIYQEFQEKIKDRLGI